jgi:hypothetical protein
MRSSKWIAAAIAAVAVAVLVVVLVTRGGDDEKITAGTDTTAVDTTLVDTTAVPDTTPPETTVPVTAAPTTTGGPTEAWSATVDAEWDITKSAFTTAGGVNDVFSRQFAVPVALPLPDDALLSYARFSAVKGFDGGYEESWSAWSTTAAAPADAEKAFAEAFSSDLFTPGTRVESEFGDFKMVTLNYQPTDAGTADGWSSMSVTVGPENDGFNATGRTDLKVELSRVVNEWPALSPFVGGWLEEVPVAEGIEPAELSVEASTQPFERVWMSMRYEAPQDAFPSIISFYGEEHSAGALVWEASTMPEGIDDLEYFETTGQNSLGGRPLTLSVDRYTEDTSYPANVNLGLKLQDA